MRKPQKKKWLELAVADIRDQERVHALSHANWTGLLVKLLALLLKWGAMKRPVVLFGDGAPMLKAVLEVLRCFLPRVYLISDWYHLVEKCKQRFSLACRGREHRKKWLQIVMPLLWEGRVSAALWRLRNLRVENRNQEAVDQLIEYIQRNQAFIPNYKRRKELGLTNGSHRAEKACDLLVAKRMKDEGMHWSEAGAEGICALRTISRNGEWDRYFPHAVGF